MDKNWIFFGIILVLFIIGIFICISVKDRSKKDHYVGNVKGVTGRGNDYTYSYVLTPEVQQLQSIATSIPIAGAEKPVRYLQNYPVSLKFERRYNDCLLDHIERGMDPSVRYDIQERCYMHAIKGNTDGTKEILCHKHKDNVVDFYNCMLGLYSGYVRADRFSGVDTCACANNETGTQTPEGCYCTEVKGIHTYPHDIRFMRQGRNNIVFKTSSPSDSA
jgi:hypothetical protein